MGFKIGDVVTLNSGGPKFTVMCLEDDGAILIAAINDGDFRTRKVPMACLQLVETKGEAQ